MTMRPKVTILALLLTSLAIVGCEESGAPAVSLSEHEDQVTSLEDEIDDREREIADLESENEELEDEIGNLKAEIKDFTAPYESAAGEAVLDDGEWREGMRAFLRRLYPPSQPKIKLPRVVVDRIAALDDIYWSPLEQRQFLMRFRRWAERNDLLDR